MRYDHRQNVYLDFDVREDVIKTPGRFFDERIYVPYLWELVIDDGTLEFTDDYRIIVPLSREDQARYPELIGSDQVVLQFEDPPLLSEPDPETGELIDWETDEGGHVTEIGRVAEIDAGGAGEGPGGRGGSPERPPKPGGR